MAVFPHGLVEALRKRSYSEMVENMGHTKRKYAACLLAGIFAVILFAVVIGAVLLRGTSKNQVNLAQKPEEKENDSKK